MYRPITRNFVNRVLQRHSGTQVRRYSGENHPRQAGFGKVLFLLTPFAATGGIIAYANYDSDFRQILVHNVPGADTILKLVLDEKKSFGDIKKGVKDVTQSVTGIFGGSSGEKYVAKSTKISEHEKTIPQKTKTVAKQEPQAVKENKSAPVEITKPKDSIELPEFEKSIDIAATMAIQDFQKAVKILNAYNEDIKKVVDQAVDKLEINAWTSLKNKTRARDTAVELAENSARNAIAKIEAYEMSLSQKASSLDHEQLQNLKNKIKTWTENIERAKDEVYKAKHSAHLSEKYWKKVESARNYFVEEIEAIFPGLNLSEQKLNLSKDDLDLFIIHAYSHTLTYQKELQKLQLDGELRLKRAIEALRGDDQNEAIKAQVDFYVDKERRNIALENQKAIFQIRAEAEKQLKQQLKRQSEVHVDHLQDALAQKEAELRRIFSRELDEKLSSEKAAYKLQLASMLGKLKGMDAALKARAESEKCAHQAQSLWAACQALWASVRTGEPGVHWRHKLRPLKSEIKAVDKAAAEGDELVAVVLQNLPKEVQTRGVYPEDALRERFIQVEKVARRLALVPEEGASLPIYVLSYLQSIFILQPDDAISAEELQNKIIDFSKLDTYDILNRARYFIDRGDLTQTLKYMNLLQGAPRKIAKDWINEARFLLETQQAANTLMAHAAASGLLYL